VWLRRFAIGYGIWLVLAGWSPWNAVVGIAAAALAVWAGGILLPYPGGSPAIPRIVRFAARFLWQSVAGGVDVAWRVFQPVMPLCPGIVKVAPRLPAGPGRLLFLALASLPPGSLACGVDEDGDLLFHCLDTREDVTGALSRMQDEFSGLWEEERA
jgi:multicomponent Na+:H+ antiporter subunit E